VNLYHLCGDPAPSQVQQMNETESGFLSWLFALNSSEQAGGLRRGAEDTAAQGDHSEFFMVFQSF
jgi:hypothetical protein